MTLGIGDRVAKLKENWVDGKRVFPEIPEIVQGEAYHEFEILALGQGQGNSQGFVAVFKLVK